MDNNTNRINSLNTNSMSSQTSNGRTQSRTATSHNRTVNSQNPNSTPISRTPGGNSDYGVARSATQLRAGDIVKGEISDLRGNEITVTLTFNRADCCVFLKQP